MNPMMSWYDWSSSVPFCATWTSCIFPLSPGSDVGSDVERGGAEASEELKNFQRGLLHWEPRLATLRLLFGMRQHVWFQVTSSRCLKLLFICNCFMCFTLFSFLSVTGSWCRRSRIGLSCQWYGNTHYYFRSVSMYHLALQYKRWSRIGLCRFWSIMQCHRNGFIILIIMSNEQWSFWI